MKKTIIVESPRGAQLTIDLAEIKSASMGKKTSLTVTYHNGETVIIGVGEDKDFDKVRTILKEITDLQNIYDEYLDEQKLKEDVFEKAVKEAMKVSETAIKETSIEELVNATKEALETLKLASSENVTLKETISQSKKEMDLLKESVSEMTAEIKRLTKSVFEE